jgi:hypothetical protein
MDLVQTRIVTDDVERLAASYARPVRVSVVNDYYVEVPAGGRPHARIRPPTGASAR